MKLQILQVASPGLQRKRGDTSQETDRPSLRESYNREQGKACGGQKSQWNQFKSRKLHQRYSPLDVSLATVEPFKDSRPLATEENELMGSRFLEKLSKTRNAKCNWTQSVHLRTEPSPEPLGKSEPWAQTKDAVDSQTLSELINMKISNEDMKFKKELDQKVIDRSKQNLLNFQEVKHWTVSQIQNRIKVTPGERSKPGIIFEEGRQGSLNSYEDGRRQFSYLNHYSKGSKELPKMRQYSKVIGMNPVPIELLTNTVNNQRKKGSSSLKNNSSEVDNVMKLTGHNEFAVRLAQKLAKNSSNQPPQFSQPSRAQTVMQQFKPTINEESRNMKQSPWADFRISGEPQTYKKQLNMKEGSLKSTDLGRNHQLRGTIELKPNSSYFSSGGHLSWAQKEQSQSPPQSSMCLSRTQEGPSLEKQISRAKKLKNIKDSKPRSPFYDQPIVNAQKFLEIKWNNAMARENKALYPYLKLEDFDAFEKGKAILAEKADRPKKLGLRKEERGYQSYLQRGPDTELEQASLFNAGQSSASPTNMEVERDARPLQSFRNPSPRDKSSGMKKQGFESSLYSSCKVMPASVAKEGSPGQPSRALNAEMLNKIDTYRQSGGYVYEQSQKPGGHTSRMQALQMSTQDNTNQKLIGSSIDNIPSDSRSPMDNFTISIMDGKDSLEPTWARRSFIKYKKDQDNSDSISLRVLQRQKSKVVSPPVKINRKKSLVKRRTLSLLQDPPSSSSKQAAVEKILKGQNFQFGDAIAKKNAMKPQKYSPGEKKGLMRYAPSKDGRFKPEILEALSKFE